MEEDNLDDNFTDNELQDNFNDNTFFDGDSLTNLGKNNELLKELTNFDPIIAKRIKNWLGLEWDAKVEDYVEKQDAIINMKGARWAIGFLQTYQSKTNIITNINEREFKNLQIDIIKLCWLVFPTIEDFEVKSTADWYRLATELEHSAFLVLAGAGDGKYTKFLGETVHRTENVNLSQHPQMRPTNKMVEGKNWWGNVKNRILGRV